MGDGLSGRGPSLGVSDVRCRQKEGLSQEGEGPIHAGDSWDNVTLELRGLDWWVRGSGLGVVVKGVDIGDGGLMINATTVPKLGW